MKSKRIISLAMSAAVLAGALTQIAARAADEQFRDMTTMEAVKEMGIGINLGNTLEATGDWINSTSQNAYETAWGSPTVTQEMIQGYADEGFGVLRIPVAWSNLMADDGTYTINEDVMARVTEIVDWSLGSGMYTIVNLHWDGGWLEKLPTEHDETLKKYEAIWTQVADNFKDYGDKLVFESQNEELGWNTVWNQWSGSTKGKEESYGYVNEVNQKFVDIVRSSGGNNDKRHLLIAGYNTGIDLTCDPLFKMPDDPANHMAVSVHYYTPSTFAILEEDADWGKAKSTWGTQAEIDELKKNMEMMKTNFVDKGIPVIIGEYGCPYVNKEAESVTRFLTAVCYEAVSRDLCPVLWDTPGGRYDRKTYQMTDRELHDALMAIRDGNGTEPVAIEPVITPDEDIAQDEDTDKEQAKDEDTAEPEADADSEPAEQEEQAEKTSDNSNSPAAAASSNATASEANPKTSSSYSLGLTALTMAAAMLITKRRKR
ncbi:MAG: glycoside hydrolase family 5 protein [Ruminococcus sp.]|nr:glycoside hydrolase family 5 protein [Ruminococcus sp.]